MKIRLLNCDGYAGMEQVVFPVEVDAVIDAGGYATVPESELTRIGCSDAFEDSCWPFGPFWPFGPSSWEKAE